MLFRKLQETNKTQLTKVQNCLYELCIKMVKEGYCSDKLVSISENLHHKLVRFKIELVLDCTDLQEHGSI